MYTLYHDCNVRRTIVTSNSKDDILKKHNVCSLTSDEITGPLFQRCDSTSVIRKNRNTQDPRYSGSAILKIRDIQDPRY